MESLTKKAYVIVGVLLLVSFALLFTPQVELVAHARTVMAGCSAGLTAAFLFFLWRQHTAADKCHVELDVRRTHFVQGIAQGSIFFYVGFYYSGVAEWAPYLVYQLIVAFVFDFLLSAYRQKRYRLGFSILPIVLSINLFMWFRPEYFAGQVAMVFAAILGKAYIVRRLEDRTVHIFNPSALPMAAATVLMVLLLNAEYMLRTNNVVASYLVPPNFLLFVFSMGMLSHLAGGVSFISLGAVSTLFLIDRAFIAATGLPPMGDILNPSVFIGITLLATDPVTSSRTRTGQLVYGCLYGIGIFGGYVLLQRFGFPTYYDKILPVPILNYLAPYFDRVRVPLSGPFRSPLWARSWPPAVVYAVVFLALLPTVDRNFLRRTYFLENQPPASRVGRAERRYPVDPELRELINRRLAERCAENPTLDACRLLRQRGR